MNPEHAKLFNKSEPPVKVYRNRADLIREEICNPLFKAGLDPKDFRIPEFANDFTAEVDAHNLYGHTTTFKPDALLDLIKSYYSGMAKAKDLKVGDRIKINGDPSTIVAVSNVFLAPSIDELVVIVVSPDIDPNYPVTYTISSSSKLVALPTE